MKKEDILTFWLDKYCPKIVDFINNNLEFEELSPEELEVKRRGLLLEYIDTSDSAITGYLLHNYFDFLGVLYKAVYHPEEKLTFGKTELPERRKAKASTDK